MSPHSHVAAKAARASERGASFLRGRGGVLREIREGLVVTRARSDRRVNVSMSFMCMLLSAV